MRPVQWYICGRNIISLSSLQVHKSSVGKSLFIYFIFIAFVFFLDRLLMASDISSSAVIRPIVSPVKVFALSWLQRNCWVSTIFLLPWTTFSSRTIIFLVWSRHLPYLSSPWGEETATISYSKLVIKKMFRVTWE